MGTPFVVTWIDPAARQMRIETDEMAYDESWVSFTNSGDQFPLAILNRDQVKLVQVDTGNLLDAVYAAEIAAGINVIR